MTQPNQSELREQFIERMHNYFGIEDESELQHFGTIYDSVVVPYITANYTPNSEVADKVNTAVVTRELELDHQWSKELERKLKEVK